MSDDKTHDATPHRRQKAREEGQVARSQDLASSLILLFGLIVLLNQGGKLAEQFLLFSTAMLGQPIFVGSELAEEDGLFELAINQFHVMVLTFLKPVGLFFMFLVGIAVIANIAQTGLLWLPNKLFSIDMNRINPMSGLKRIFSLQAVMRLVMGICKIVICAIVAYFAVKNEIGAILSLTDKDENQIALYLLTTLLTIAIKVSVALTLIAVADFMYQKWKHEQDLKMSTQELRDEIKNMMGDPQMISKRRQVHREMAQSQGRGSVLGTEDADVVVTNPTHYAVAIKYDVETMDAPVVVAKGADFLAKQIRKIALENGIPIVEHKPLAQGLYKTVEIGMPILNDEYYAALAEILAYAYRLSGRNINRELQRLKQRGG